MWPFTDKRGPPRGPKSQQTVELERHYREHLARLEPDRVRLLQGEVHTADRVLNAHLMADCVQTVKEFKREVADNPDIQDVLPGYSKDYLCISVVIKPEVDMDGRRQRLPEFFRGYMVRCAPASP